MTIPDRGFPNKGAQLAASIVAAMWSGAILERAGPFPRGAARTAAASGLPFRGLRGPMCSSFFASCAESVLERIRPLLCEPFDAEAAWDETIDDLTDGEAFDIFEDGLFEEGGLSKASMKNRSGCGAASTRNSRSSPTRSPGDPRSRAPISV